MAKMIALKGQPPVAASVRWQAALPAFWLDWVSWQSPALGLSLRRGWLVAALTGAAAGGATGGIIGALSQQAGLSEEETEVYAEGLRRGGAIVSARVADADAARLQATMDRSAVRIADRAAAYRKSGWSTYDPNAKPYTVDEVMRERSLYR